MQSKQDEWQLEPRWIKTISTHIPLKFAYIVRGYIRNIENKGLYSTIPTVIMIKILIMTYYFQPLLTMLNLIWTKNYDGDKLTIMNDIVKFLDPHESWDLSIVENICSHIDNYLQTAITTLIQEVASVACWFLATAEHQSDDNISIIMIKKPTKKLFEIFTVWEDNFHVLSSALNIFANITGTNDLSASRELIEHGIIDLLCEQSHKLHSMAYWKQGISSLEHSEMVSLTLRNLTKYEPLMSEEEDSYDKYAQVLQLMLDLLCTLHKYFQNQLVIKPEYINFYYMELLKSVELGLDNIVIAFCQMIKNNYEMLDLIMNKLTTNDRVLTKCFQLLSYPKNSRIRHNIIKVIKFITTDPEHLHIDALIDHGLINKIIQIFNGESELKFKLSKIQRGSMLSIIHNILDCEGMHVEIFSDNDKILQIILHHIQHDYNSKLIKGRAFSCFNNSLALHEPQIALKLIKFENGLIINIICSNLDKCEANKMKSISYEMECIHHLIHEMKMSNSLKKWIMVKLKNKSIIQIFLKLKLIKDEKDSFEVDEEYLTELHLQKYSPDIKYLSKLIDITDTK